MNSFLTMLKKTDFLEKGSFPLWDSKVHLAHKASLTNVHGIGSSAFSEAFSHLVKNALSFFPQHDLVEKKLAIMFLAFVLATFYPANWKQQSSFSFFSTDITAALKNISFIMAKVEMAKISICKCETILPFEEAESIKCYEVNGLLLSLPYPDGKTFLHFQMNIFCHFKFCINRKNGFQSICFKCLRVKHCIGFQRMQKKGH